MYIIVFNITHFLIPFHKRLLGEIFYNSLILLGKISSCSKTIVAGKKALSLQPIKGNYDFILRMNYFEKVNIYITKCIKAYLLTIRHTRNSTNNTRTKTAMIAPMTVNGMSSAATKKKRKYK